MRGRRLAMPSCGPELEPPMIFVDSLGGARRGLSETPKTATPPTTACDVTSNLTQRNSHRSSVVGARFSEFPCLLGESAYNRTHVRVVYDHGCRGSGPARASARRTARESE